MKRTYKQGTALLLAMAMLLALCSCAQIKDIPPEELPESTDGTKLPAEPGKGMVDKETDEAQPDEAPKQPAVSQEEEQEAPEELEKVFCELARIDREYGYEWSPQPPLAGQKCLRHLYSCVVKSNGDVIPCVGLDCVIGSIRDVERLRFVMERYRPDVVFHAAAHKHVPLMETSPYEAIKNNILGTRNVLEAASRCGVGHFVQISTDKAVNPTNVMGTTKRVTELLVKYYAQHTPMKCIAVRFGNVLGSHGSVIPLLEHQIESGGPVTITHPDIVRFFMTIEEAAQLILHANAEERTNTIFVLDMGRPVKILDLAKQLIAFHGLRPDEDIQIVYTGLRPGEKMYEELLYDNEDKVLLPTSNDRIMALNDGEHCMDGLLDLIDRLGALAEAEDPAAIAQLQALVPNARLGIAG